MPLGPFRVEYICCSPEIPQKRGYSQKARLLNGPKKHAIAAAGTSYRQSELVQALRILKSMRAPKVFDAELVYESNNRHDPNAVACYIAGEHVGYLPAALCVEYRRALRPLIPKGMRDIPLWCKALFVGGGRDQYIGVRLDLPKSKKAVVEMELSKSECLERTE